MKTLVFTGGHHNSALLIAQDLKQAGWNIIWFGHRHSMWGDMTDSAEYTEVTTAGIKFYNLLAGKFYKTYNPLKLIRIPIGFIQSLLFLLYLRPVGIVSFGGYLAVPVVICGWLLGIPSVTHEQTVVAGFANRLIAPFAKKIAVSWPTSLSHYPKSKVVLTGLPLRPEIINIKKSKPATSDQRPATMYITGGKQGSHLINEAVFAALPELTQKYHVIHQTGTSSVHNDLTKAQGLNYPNYSPFGYDSQKAIVGLQSAHIVISRAGAHTIYELMYLGTRCVLIPIPWVSHDEQNLNAQKLVDLNQAVILPQSKLSPDSLLTAVNQAHILKPKSSPPPSDGHARLLQLVLETFS